MKKNFIKNLLLNYDLNKEKYRDQLKKTKFTISNHDTCL